jgi:hypothetical protein
MALQRAKRALEEGDAKLRTLKRWTMEYDSRVQPLVKQMEKLHTVLTQDMVLAVAFLTQAINTLAAYAEVRAPAAEPVPQAAGRQPSPDGPSKPGQS